MKRMMRPQRARSGVALGWLLGALAVITVVVIVVILVWQPGGQPAPEEEAAPPATEEEAPAEEPADEAAAPDEGEDAAAAEDGEAAPGEDGEAAEGEAPAEGDDAEATADGEDAAEGEAPAEGEEPEEEADAGAPEDEAQADAPDDAEEESPGPVDATVETDGDVELQADAENREIEAGGQSAEAVGATVTAIADAEARLEGLEAADAGEGTEREPMRVEGSTDGAEARVRDAEIPSAPDVSAVRESAEGAQRSEREQDAQGPRTSLGGGAAPQQEAAQARARTAEVQDAATRTLEGVRSSIQSVERTERPTGERAAVELRTDASQRPATDEEARTITLQPIETGDALQRAQPGIEAAE